MNWDKLFNPRSIAVIGASTKEGLNINMFFSSLAHAKFPGNLYPVNRHAEQVLGYPAFRSVRDIPGPVDYAIIAVPRNTIIDVVKDCIAKQVPVAHIFTAGFQETATPEGQRLNRELKELISGRIRLIGPNCVGIYCPRAHVAYLPQQSLVPGDIGFVSQSGGHNSLFVETATTQGLHFSKAISVGNAMDLGINDFLEYLGQDPDTGIIGVYVEGMRDEQGRDFFRLARSISPEKPVMLMKAGRGESGVRAAASHTGSMAGTYSLWEHMAAQANAVMVDDYTEMADFIWAYKCIENLPSLRSGVVCGGGGNSVWCGDTLSSLGLTLPALSLETQRQILQLTAAVGTIPQNPVDPNFSMFDPEAHYGVLTTLDVQPDIDVLINVAVFDFLYHHTVGSGLFTREEVVEDYVRRLATIRRRVRKPFLAVAFHVSENGDMTALLNQVRQEARKKGVPCYSSFQRMAVALKRLYAYYRRRNAGREAETAPSA
jgi:acyl-CoA synthetase (NDP forming)